MNHDHTQRRKQIAARIEQAIAQSSRRHEQGTLARELGIPESALSMYIRGRRGIPAEYLPELGRIIGVAPEVLLLGESVDDSALRVPISDPFAHTLSFLEHAQYLGVTHILPDRTEALSWLVPHTKAMHKGRICITGSSLKGLSEATDKEFTNLLQRYREERPQVRISVMLTHPIFARLREQLEERSVGSIMTDVFAGLTWCIDKLRVDPDQDIRLSKASPCLFSIFVDRIDSAVGLVNPYPLMENAFGSVSLIVHRNSQSRSIYGRLFSSNFNGPWNSTKVTVGLHQALEECMYTRDEIGNQLGIAITEAEENILHTEAHKFKAFLNGRSR